MPPNPNKTPAERAARIKDELLAEEQEAAEELIRKWEALQWAQAQRSLEEAVQRVREEEVWEEAERQAQEEAWEVARHWVLEENEMNAHPDIRKNTLSLECPRK